jgi:polar amino acid transport system permease protein
VASIRDPGLDVDRPEGSRRPRLFGDTFRQEGAKGVAIAVVSTAVVIGTLVFLVVRSTYWPDFKQQFFNGEEFARSFPDIVEAFRRNILYFLVAEPSSVWALTSPSSVRSGSGLFPLGCSRRSTWTVQRVQRWSSTSSASGCRLQIPGLPVAGWFWGMTGLILSYSAYVAEVYRAGIESVHPSQSAAARALGLSRWQTLRYVVIPQAVRRVIPPLMNDFIALQKDTALIAVVSGTLPEAFLMGQIYQTGDFNFTPILGVALCFLVITIPMTRLTDWLLERQRRRRQAGATV